MNSDTKVGVLVGLVIVVVASGYFYGSNRDDSDLFVSPDGSAASVPKIPLSTDRKVVVATPSARDVATSLDDRPRTFENVGRHAAPKPQSPGRLNDRSDARRSNPAIPEGFRVPQNRIQWQPGDAISDPRQAFDTGSFAEAADGPADRFEPNEPAMIHTSLRSGAAEALTEATRANLQSATDSAAASPQAQRPPPPEPPAETWPQQHELQEGETLYEIALLYYGSGREVSRILDANPKIKNPRRIRPGLSITLPDPSLEPVKFKPAPPSTAPQNADSPRTYDVRKGDSFYTIAKHLYGDGRRWNAIYELNRALVKDNPKRLREGMTIKLPPDE